MINQHKTIRECIAKFNKPNPLAEHLIPYLQNKPSVSILDIGSGPYSIIGDHLPGRYVNLHLADNQDFTEFWKKYNAVPFLNVEREDMENLTYPDNFFDLVHCVNALDHTADALQAVKEMIRVCKPGGFVYIDCHLDQLETGHKHKWNVKEDGYIMNPNASFHLGSLGFKIKYIDNGGERRYNHIIATLQKGAND